MWEYQSEVISPEQAIKYSVFENGKKLTFAEVITWLKVSQEFRHFYNSLLADAAFAAFFWETPSNSHLTQAQAFEFVLVKSESLNRIKPNPTPFQAYFEESQAVVSFSNLGRDAYLIVPCPIAALDCYAHLAAFVRLAPEQQRDTFWKSIGEQYEKQLNEKPVWLSTAGLGVSWLHITIDSQPKYYRYDAYKELRIG